MGWATGGFYFCGQHGVKGAGANDKGRAYLVSNARLKERGSDLSIDELFKAFTFTAKLWFFACAGICASSLRQPSLIEAHAPSRIDRRTRCASVDR